MKMIATTDTFLHTSQLIKQIMLPINNVSLLSKRSFIPLSRRGIFLFLLTLTGFIANTAVFAQAQTIGSFPEMQGGLENQAISSLPVGTASYTAGATVTTFSRNNNTSGVTADIRATGGNSGPTCLEWANGSTSATIFTPTAATDAVLSNTSYVVQFFARRNTSTTNRQFNVRVYTNGANFSEVSTTQTGTTTYQKFTAIVTTPVDAATGKTGYVGVKPKGGSFGSGLTYLLDDFCMYAGSAVDVTAPGDATSAVITGYTSSSLDVSWTAPSGGVDGGGYVVVRYATNPAAEPAPTANGIYAVGNTIGAGTVVYIGTGTSFTSTGLAASSTYFYRVYAVDKAFNYSTTPAVVSGFTGLANATVVTFTTPGGCQTDRIILSWTGPLSYNATNNTLLAFLKQGSAVTIGTPTNNPSTYNPSTNFSAPIAPNYQGDASARCIYRGDGTNAAGDHSGLTITGLLPNTTYHVLIFNVVDAVPSYSSGVTANGTTLAAAFAEPTNHPTAFVKGTVTTTSISPSWAFAVAGAQAPTGYMLQASNAGTPADPTDGIDILNQTNITSGTANFKVTPNTATTYAGFTGFTAGTMYNFRINSYTNAGSCINYKATGPTINVATLPNAVTLPSLAITGTTGTITWTAAPAYNSTNHTTLVFVKASVTAITVGSPSANPSIYTANTASPFGTAYQLDAAAFCAYKGDATTVTITGLSAATTYQVLVLTVVDAANSDATHSYSAYTSTLATTGATYTWKAGNTTGSWTLATNWVPDRNTPATSDILIFNTGETIIPTNLVTQTIAKLYITGNTNLTFRSVGFGGSRTLTIASNNGLLNNDLIIDLGSTFNIDKIVPAASTVILNNNTTADISGTMNVIAGCTYNTNAAGDLTTVSGTLKNSGTVTCTASNMLVTSTGTYEHAINGGATPIPTATWNTGSTCLISGITSAVSLLGLGQTFSKLVWDCPSQATALPNPFVLGANTASPNCVIVDSFIVRRTGTGTLQITSTGGQQNFTCGNYFQYGGLVAITYNTNSGGTQRSLTVNNTFYVTDSLQTGAKFQIINNPGGTTNIAGRLFVRGNVDMHSTLSATTLEAFKDNVTNPSIAEIYFTGSTAQAVKFSTISGSIDFITNHTGSGVTLQSNATANKFTLTQGIFYIDANTLTINNVVTGTGTIGGSTASNLTLGLNGTTGTLNFTPGYRILKDFTQLAGNTTTLGTELAIAAGTSAGRDSLGTGATLNTNDNLILRSDNDGTARIAQLTTATINGKVTVERYLPMNTSSDARRWRLLTAPFKTTNSPTINAAWQEGQSNPDRNNPSPYDPRPGYGTHITKSTTWSALDGFDQGSTNTPSILYHSAGSWIAPANTNSVKITDNSGCYMLFARGDRSIVISGTTVAAVPTTLAPKGEVHVGNVVIPMVPTTAFQSVGNPYASQIKLDNIDFNGTLGKSSTVYLWDPKTLGTSNVGKFISCSGNGAGGYTYTANTSGYGTMPGVIESSVAFMIQGNGTPGNITFHESDKTIKNSTIGIASRPVISASAFGKIRSLYTELLVIKNGIPTLADGIANTFNRNYKNSIDKFDATKLTTFATKEELSIRRDTKLFAIERRKSIVKTDTIFLNIYRLNIGNYQFNFKPEEFDNTYSAYLEDTYLGSKSPISLSQQTTVPFAITAVSGSSAFNRFHIILERNQPAKNVSLAATRLNNDIELSWNNSDEDDIDAQVIERSTNGDQFTEIATKEPTINTVGEALYNWMDANPLPGIYYYRIRFTDAEGRPAYSNVVKVAKYARAEKPAIIPNPATNGQISLYMGNLPKGNYTTRVINNAGQEVFRSSVNYQDTNSKILINMKQKNETGMFYLEVISADKVVATLKFLLL